MEIRKSKYDRNEYREVRLENGIVALVISKQHRGVERLASTYSQRSNEDSDDGSDTTSASLSSWEYDEDGEVVRKASGDEDFELSTASESENDDEKITFKSACAVCIKSGSLSDPPDIPGLAHLLEHMVFMGSEKYKGENVLDSFLSKHGGHCNAFTDYETTTFYFTINSGYFKKALDMFAHFFISPLILESSLEREVEAVDSEFQTSLQSDSDRLQRLLCSLANTDHPYSSFVWGNSKSLVDGPKEKGIRVGERLREFYQRHYSSHYMTIAAMSTDSLDDLEQWTIESFSTMRNNSMPPPSFNHCPSPFKPETFHRLYSVVPVADVNKIQLIWELPPLLDKYRVKPMEYVSWLLGHEAEGSVLYHLKKKNFATGIMAGNGEEGFEFNSCFSLFNCTITLTDKGQKHIQECLECIFQYIHMMKKLGPQERIYRDIQTVEENNFTFIEEENPEDYVEEVSEAMQRYPKEDYLTGGLLLLDYNPEVISGVMECLTPDTVNIMWSSQGFKDQCTRNEEWFGTPFHSEGIPDEWKSQWKNSTVPEYLHLPHPNPFLATDFTIKDLSQGKPYPVITSQDDRHRLWFRQDAVFQLPRAYIFLILETPVHHISAKNAVLMDMFAKLLKLSMCGVLYNAEMAMLGCSCKVRRRGLVIQMNGLNEKLPDLFKKIIASIVSFSTCSSGDFDMIKEKLRRTYNNHELDPEYFSSSTLHRLLLPDHWCTSHKRSVIDDLTIENLMELVEQFRGNLFTEMLIQGNITLQEARELAQFLCSEMKFEPLTSEHRFKMCVKKLQERSFVSIEVPNRDQESPNSVVIDHYQCCSKTVKSTAIVQLLESCMEEAAFNELRTKKQLGYSVSVESNTIGVIAFCLKVVSQSAKNSVEWVCRCMEEFLSNFSETIRSWKKRMFKSQVDALIQEKLEPDVSLEEEVSRNWEEILLTQYCFDYHLQEVEVLRELTQQEVCKWLDRYIRKGDSLKKLCVKVKSSDCKTDEEDSCDGDRATLEEPDGVLGVFKLKESDIDEFKDKLETVTAVYSGISEAHTFLT